MKATEFMELQAFGLVAKHRSFAKAAAELGVSRSGITQTIQNLERRLGIRLLNRTTRTVLPTKAGEDLQNRLEPTLAALSIAVTQMQKYRDTPEGIVRIASSALGAKLYLEPILAGFREAYPDVVLDITIDNTEYHDCVSEGLDAAVGLEPYIHKDMIALKLGGALHFNIVASPSYLANHGEPKTPYDLPEHKCIAVRHSGQAESQVWPFVKDNHSFSVTINRPMMVNNEFFALDAAINGAGILFCSKEMSAHFIRDGILRSLLDSWCIDWSGFFLYYPQQKQTTAAFQAFKDYIRKAASTISVEQTPVEKTRLYKARQGNQKNLVSPMVPAAKH